MPRETLPKKESDGTVVDYLEEDPEISMLISTIQQVLCILSAHLYLIRSLKNTIQPHDTLWFQKMPKSWS